MIKNSPLALKLTNDRKIDFDDAFCLQFLLTKNSDLTVGSFTKKSAGDWTIYYGNDLPVIQLKDRENNLAGYFLGIGVYKSGQIVSEDFFKSLSQKAVRSLEVIDEEISEHAGR